VLSLRTLRPTGLRGRLVITFTVVAVTASVLVAGIAYQLVRQELLRRVEQAEVTDVRNVLERITLPVGTTDLLWPSGASVTESDLNAIVESLAAPPTGRWWYGTAPRSGPPGAARSASPRSRWRCAARPSPGW